MKKQYLRKSCYAILCILLTIFSHSFVQAQTYDVYVDNRQLTSSTTMEFDVFIRSNGSTGIWPLRTYQAGYRMGAAFVNGGTLTGAYIAGSSELTETSFGKTWSFSWNATQNVLNQSANTGGICPGAIIGNTARKIGRFRLTNTVAWGCTDDSMTYVLPPATGTLALAITKWNTLDCTNPVQAVTITANATASVAGPNRSVLLAAVSGPAATVCGRDTTVTVSATGGVSPYTGTGTFTRGSGTFTFTVSDSRGCTSSASITIASSPDQIAPVIVKCASAVTLTGNTVNVPDFTSDVIATDNCTPAGSLVITQTPLASTPVGPGTYTITLTITDGAGNSSTCQTVLTVLEPCNAVATLAAGTPVTCFGGSNGTASIVLTNAGATPSGTYSVDGGSAIAFSGTSFLVSGLAAGPHSVVVTIGSCTTSTGQFTTGGPAAPLSSSFSATACDSYTLPWGTTVTVSGPYTNVYQSVNGCDSTVTANITINLTTNNSTSAVACENALPYEWNGSSYTTSGTYTFSYTNAAGCPSTDTLRLEVPNGNYWTGAVSDVWENPANWGCGSVPDATTVVYIEAGKPFYPVVRSEAFCKKIFIATGTTLDVSTGFRLNVTGTD